MSVTAAPKRAAPQNRAHFDRKFAQCRCRTCALDARSLRTLILTTFAAILCTHALSGKLWQALGASCAPKMRQDSSKLLRFSLKIMAFESKVSWRKASLRSEKVLHLVQRASKGCWCLFGKLCVHRWPKLCGFSKSCMQREPLFWARLNMAD